MITQLINPGFGAALAEYGSALCYFAAGVGILMLAWSYIDNALQNMETAMRNRIDEINAACDDLEMDGTEPLVADTVRLYSGEVKHG